MGIDPGLKATGWAVVKSEKSGTTLIDVGVVQTSQKDDIHHKLHSIFSELCSVAKKHVIAVASIENVFVNSNPKASMYLCYGRCAAILAMMECKIDIFEYSPTKIKKCVFGSGHASKDQIAFMVNSTLSRPVSLNISNHSTDAIGAALCHIFSTRHTSGIL
ncbi:crossover junction endodeoxyribonuclease RuvC [Candidatus Anaplasma sp. TIGMIC]|uniref:crossover junction endodeoxyribonuclease RuvC n=1 Tax=Candidatus Anaplasma sp. TIGMIC TaxID=3020713 RepID=UPI00232CC0B3|nr:crossover junction endodeoxyribonuclease RuvC [Candidatus Anaplasma sp. TIGMIC]MDB1135481.1 crossover junction endodeoxyribonuclease RuvC [Candidatus Anaplasma sp. TIGMIC]